MNAVARALLKGLASQFHPRMLLLTLLPFVLTSLIWTAIWWVAAEPALNAVQGLLLHFPAFERLVEWLFAGNVDRVVAFMHDVMALLVLMFLALPLVVMTVVVIVGVTTMPVVVSHLSRRRYAGVVRRGRSGAGALLDDGLHALLLTLLAVVLTIPLWLVPVVGWVLPLMLWGWINARIMARDALSSHAEASERIEIMRRKRFSLWLLGMATGACGIVPTLIWVGVIPALVFAPLFALVSLWLYVLVFTYTALVFGHYTLAALERQRAGAAPPAASIQPS